MDKVVLFYAETELGEGAVPFAAGVGSPLLSWSRQMKRGDADDVWGGCAGERSSAGSVGRWARLEVCLRGLLRRWAR